MKLSEKRRTAIYAAIHEEIMQARIEIAGKARRSIVPLFVAAEQVDEVLSRAQDKAGQAAIRAAERSER